MDTLHRGIPAEVAVTLVSAADAEIRHLGRDITAHPARYAGSKAVASRVNGNNRVGIQPRSSHLIGILQRHTRTRVVKGSGNGIIAQQLDG